MRPSKIGSHLDTRNPQGEKAPGGVQVWRFYRLFTGPPENLLPKFPPNLACHNREDMFENHNDVRHGEGVRSIYRAKALEYHFNPAQEPGALAGFSRRLIVWLWILVCLLCVGGASLAWLIRGSLTHG